MFADQKVQLRGEFAAYTRNKPFRRWSCPENVLLRMGMQQENQRYGEVLSRFERSLFASSG